MDGNRITLDQPIDRSIIYWSDEGGCRFPVSQLRMACPCPASHRGHASTGHAYEAISPLDLNPDSRYKADQSELVSHYARPIVWKDGHQAGIAPRDYLSRLCPLEE